VQIFPVPVYIVWLKKNIAKITKSIAIDNDREITTECLAHASQTDGSLWRRHDVFWPTLNGLVLWAVLLWCPELVTGVGLTLFIFLGWKTKPTIFIIEHKFMFSSINTANIQSLKTTMSVGRIFSRGGKCSGFPPWCGQNVFPEGANSGEISFYQLRN